MTNTVTALKKLSALSFKALEGISRPDVFKLMAGAILAFNGLAGLLSALGNGQLQDMPDPIFGFSIRYSMLALGAAQLLVAMLCLFTNQIQLCLWLAAWQAGNFLTYRIGLWSMGWHRSCGFLLGQLGFSLQVSDFVLSSSSLILLAGSATMLWFQRRTIQVATTRKMNCPSCGVRIRFAVRNLGQKTPCPQCENIIILRNPEEAFKTSCFFCHGHIEFPAHALGQKMPCPHCQMDITLKEPA
jgi:hypothetical protein